MYSYESPSIECVGGGSQDATLGLAFYAVAVAVAVGVAVGAVAVVLVAWVALWTEYCWDP